MKNKFRKIMHVIIIIIFVILLVYILDDARSRIKEQRKIQNIQSIKQKSIKYDEFETNDFEETSQCQEKQILKEYKNLYEQNNDLYGWIKIENTNIDYPVMFTPNDPNFYIDKNWDKDICRNNVGTSIWVDERITEDSENIIIYGHNMHFGMMFGSLKKYYNKDYYEEHKYIEFDTLYEKATYEIISVLKTQDYGEEKGNYQFYDHIELNSEADFQEYIDNAKKNAEYEIETTAKYGDKLITLSTCDYYTTNGRLLIIAKKIN